MAAVLSLLVTLLCSLSAAAVGSKLYVVGGSNGWTLHSDFSYEQWSAGISFVVGDSLEFNYPKQAHSVLEVTRSNYRYCNTTNPLASFQDGKTVIQLSNPGSYYFICGIPGHCVAGQKFMVKVASAAAAAVPTAPVSEPSLEPAMAPSPETVSEPSLEPAMAPSPETVGRAIPPAVAAAPALVPVGAIVSGIMLIAVMLAM